MLLADAHDLARPATALPETAVVEGENGEPGVVEPLGEQVGRRLLRHRQTAGHDHAAAVGSRVVPGGALGVAASEVNLLALCRCERRVLGGGLDVHDWLAPCVSAGRRYGC